MGSRDDPAGRLYFAFCGLERRAPIASGIGTTREVGPSFHGLFIMGHYILRLWLGADGYTASLFPGTPAVEEQTLGVRKNVGGKPGIARRTLTLPVLNAAEEIIFLMPGTGKTVGARDFLEGPKRPELLPAQRIKPATGRLKWFIDEEAASLLSAAARSVG